MNIQDQEEQKLTLNESLGYSAQIDDGFINSTEQCLNEGEMGPPGGGNDSNECAAISPNIVVQSLENII